MKTKGTARKQRLVPQGFVLDDVISAIRQLRRAFDLPEKVTGSITGAESFRAKAIVAQLIKTVLSTHERQIFASAFASQKKRTNKAQAGNMKTGGFLRLHPRVAPEEIEPALRVIIDLFLDTVTQLPRRDPRPDLKRVVALGERSGTLAREIRVAFDDTNLRVVLPRDPIRAERIVEDLTWLSEAIEHISNEAANQKTIRVDSPNPQIRLALYFTGWIEAATGRKKVRRFGRDPRCRF